MCGVEELHGLHTNFQTTKSVLKFILNGLAQSRTHFNDNPINVFSL